MNKLIFDIGMHNGDDTAYYLTRGFNVIALEANPTLCDLAHSRFKREIQEKRLTIVNAALWKTAGEVMNFYLSPVNDEWSSLYQEKASSWTTDAPQQISVDTITLQNLVEIQGVPHYIKCDVEGADLFFCQQLLDLDSLPDFVSVENGSLDLLAFVRAAGYEQFQIINQAKVRRFIQEKNYDGVYGHAKHTMTGHSSGDFGFDLEPRKWVNFSTTASRLLAHKNMMQEDPDMVLDNWFDIHARRSDS